MVKGCCYLALLLGFQPALGEYRALIVRQVEEFRVMLWQLSEAKGIQV